MYKMASKGNVLGQVLLISWSTSFVILKHRVCLYDHIFELTYRDYSHELYYNIDGFKEIHTFRFLHLENG